MSAILISENICHSDMRKREDVMQLLITNHQGTIEQLQKDNEALREENDLAAKVDELTHRLDLLNDCLLMRDAVNKLEKQLLDEFISAGNAVKNARLMRRFNQLPPDVQTSVPAYLASKGWADSDSLLLILDSIRNNAVAHPWRRAASRATTNPLEQLQGDILAQLMEADDDDAITEVKEAIAKELIARNIVVNQKKN
jgi:hypothetical protein